MRAFLHSLQNLRNVAYQQLFPLAWPKAGLSPLNKFLAICILSAVALAVLETEPSFADAPAMAIWLTSANSFFAIVFTLELVARFWAAGEDPNYKGLLGRLRYAVKLSTLIDIIALLPFYVTLGDNGTFMLRLFRFLRIFMLARLGRYSEALLLLRHALAERRHELFISIALAGIALLVSATCLYILEGRLNPDAFGSIPRALWWSVATLTTVGYGDVYPVTVLGRVFGGLTALVGVAIIAMPTGIIAAAFSDALQQRRKDTQPPK